MYKLSPTQFNQTKPTSVIRTTDGACIPFAVDNSDYAEYLKWISEGNAPLPAEVTQ